MAAAITTMQHSRAEEEEEESEDQRFPRITHATAHGGERQVVHQDTTASWEIRASFKNFEEIMDRRSSKLKSAGGDDQPDDHVFKDWGDMYSWFRAGYVPLLWEEGPHGRGLLANRIRLIGGVRFGKEVAKPVDCSAGRPEKEWINLVYNHSCFESVPEEESTEQETYWLDVAQDVNTTLAHIDWLDSSGWITQQTTEVTIQAFFFNAQSQTFVLSQMQVTLEDTGYLHGKMETLMVPSDIYAQQTRFWLSNVAADVLAGFCLAACALVEALMWRQAVKHRELKAFIFNIYRLSNLLSLVGGVLYLAYYGVLSGSVDQIGLKLVEYTKTQAYPDRPPGAGSGPWQARYDLLNDIHAFTEDAAVWYRGAQWICFWYMLVLLIKFGEGLPVSPRLMIFVNTLYDAIGSIFYFFIVFFVVFANFAMGAHFLFGHILYSWSTTFLPFASSLRVLMGDFDFMGMYDIAPVSSVSWFMLFIVMVAFVLVNLFIAIVTDSYQRVHHDTVGSPHEDMLLDFARTLTNVGTTGANNVADKLGKLQSPMNALSKIFSESGSRTSTKRLGSGSNLESPHLQEALARELGREVVPVDSADRSECRSDDSIFKM